LVLDYICFLTFFGKKVQKYLLLCLCSYQLFAEMVAAFFGNTKRRLPVVVGKIRTRAGPKEQPHGLRLVLNNAVVEGRVPLPRPPVQRGGVLNDKVHHVERGSRLFGDGVVQARLRELLQK
jgi:hypothetical protein